MAVVERFDRNNELVSDGEIPVPYHYGCIRGLDEIHRGFFKLRSFAVGENGRIINSSSQCISMDKAHAAELIKILTRYINDELD